MESHLRRLIDIVVAGIGLILLSPVIAVIAIFIKRDSKGPVFFHQERVGINGKRFSLHKFRSMTVSSEEGPQVTALDDSRITATGAKLRSMKLDEVPQLVNVLWGQMSLVGPRPEVPQYAQYWAPDQAAIILSVPPGLTDPVTLKLRREEQLLAAAPDPVAYYVRVLLPEKAAAYVEYVRSRSLTGDVKLLAETVAAVVFR